MRRLRTRGRETLERLMCNRTKSLELFQLDPGASCSPFVVSIQCRAHLYSLLYLLEE